MESDICVIQGRAKINNNIKVKYFYFKLLPFFRELKRLNISFQKNSFKCKLPLWGQFSPKLKE